MRWTTSPTKVMMGTIKVDPKKDVCHSTLVIEVLMQQNSINFTKRCTHWST